MLIWTPMQIGNYVLVVSVIIVLFSVLCIKKSFSGMQFILIAIIIAYTGIILECTLLARPLIGGEIRLDPLFEWRTIISSFAEGRQIPLEIASYIIEIGINVLMLFPIGIVIPSAIGKPINILIGLLIGIVISLIIEILQLSIKVGMFQTEDIINNSLGFMIGCVLGNCLVRSKRKVE